MRVTSSKYPSLNIDGLVQFEDGVADVEEPKVLTRLRALDAKHGVKVEDDTKSTKTKAEKDAEAKAEAEAEAEAKAKAEAEKASGTADDPDGTSGDAGSSEKDGSQGGAQTPELPKGNASREVWAEHATARGVEVTDEMKAGEIKAAVAALDEA